MKDHSLTRRVLCLFLAAVPVFCLSSCGKTVSEKSLKIVDNQVQNAQYHIADPGSYRSVMKSGLYEMFLDETNFSVAISDTVGNLHYALPAVENTVGAMINIEVSDGINLYRMNSQDNAVAFGTASWEGGAYGVSIHYTFSEKAGNSSVSLPLTLELELQDGIFSAAVDTSAVAPEYEIKSIDILPTFGAVTDPKNGDFIVIPDGSGALLGLASEEGAEYVLDTYGNDPSKSGLNTHPAIAAVFGLKHGTSAFAGIVTDGDAVSRIKATTGAIDCVGASFTEPGGEKLRVVYKFISGSAATYSSLASMCREEFVRDGMMSTRSVSSEGNLPVNITVTANSKNKFENAEDMASVLKAKGINALNIRYDGIIRNFRLQSRYGSGDSLNSLTAYLTSQGFGFFATTDLFEAETADAKALTRNVLAFVKRMKNYDFSGYCLGDVGNSLPSTEKTSRQEFKNAVFTQAISLSNNRELMVDSGNLFVLKNADIVSCLPLHTTYQETENYIAVPFVQMILRGTVEYTSPYLNGVEDYDTELLRCLEFGAMPAYTLTFDSRSDNYYENWSGKALDAYRLFDTVLSDLRSARMTDHKKVKDDLYVTEYNKETYVYINYSSEVSYYNGLTIQPMSYLRVN